MKILKYIVFTFLLIGGSFLISCTDEDPADPDNVNSLTADAGIDISALIGERVELDGTNSSDSDGEAFLFNWAISSAPGGSTASLEDSNTSQPTFEPDVAGIYVIELTISNDNEEESKDEVNITVAEAPDLVFISEDIDENLTLTNRITQPGIPDYCINGEITVTADLIIEPGVVIVFTENTSLLINNDGVLIANGTEQDRIIFKAKNEGEKWKGLAFKSSDDNRNRLNYVTITDGGSDEISSIDEKANLAIGSFTELNISNTIIENSANAGLFLSSFSEFLSFENNLIRNNSTQGIIIPADQIRKLDAASDFSQGNGENVVEIFSGDVDIDDETSVWNALTGDIPYLINTDIEIGSNVVINEGARFLFGADQFLKVSGDNSSLAVNGTEENKVIFTAADNSNPWRGIAFINADDVRNIINYAEISYAGLDLISVADFKAGLVVEAFSELTLTNTTINNSVNNGMFAEKRSDLLQFKNNKFENNNGNPLIIGAENLGKLDPDSQYGLSNKTNEIMVLGESISLDEVTTWPAPADGTPFIVTDDIDISSGVIVSPGARFLFESDIELKVSSSGYLTAKATSDQDKIVFTAYDQSLPWRGIGILSDDVRNELKFVEVSYAGSDLISVARQKANIFVNAFEELKVSNCFINNSVGYGVFSRESAIINDGSNASQIEAVNSFANNALGNVRIDE